MTTTAIATDAAPTDDRLGTSRPLQRVPTRPVRFSPRERQIVKFITAGCSNQEIGDSLGLRTQTVKNHLSRIYRKLGVSNRVHLAVFAVGHGMGPVSP
jgi:DNA-binding NarL/FixJ family response regulator